MELHGGSVRVDQSPLGGAQFEVTLPLTAPGVSVTEARAAGTRSTADPQDAPPVRVPADVAAVVHPSQGLETAPSPLPAGAPLVLIVEDHPDMNAFIQRVLSPRFRVAAAFDGRAGFEQACHLRPDLVVTDVMMPGLSGLELVRELRAVEALRDLPIVVLTARTDDSLRLDLLRSGVHDTVLKPFVPGELLARVSNLVELARSRAILRTQLDAVHGDLETMSLDVARRGRELQLVSRELETARDQAVRALRLREEFISIASHELRTPLTSLKLVAQLAVRQLQQERAERPQPDPTREVLDRLSAHVQRLARLVEGMLDFSRVQSGRLEIDRAPADLVAIVRAVVEEFTDRPTGAGLEIRVAAEGAVAGQWDAFRLEQVVRNLLSNALKYGSKQPVEVEVAEKAGEAVLVVRDRGIGIAPGDHQRIFEPFERAVSGRQISGFGLGLYIARQIVEAHNGVITVDSAPGQGSTFTVRIPCTADARFTPGVAERAGEAADRSL